MVFKKLPKANLSLKTIKDFIYGRIDYHDIFLTEVWAKRRASEILNLGFTVLMGSIVLQALFKSGILNNSNKKKK